MNQKCNICEGVGLSRKATNCIQIIGGKNGDIILYLCISCTKLFDDPLCNTDKKTLEQQAVEPWCSNASDIQPKNNPGDY